MYLALKTAVPVGKGNPGLNLGAGLGPAWLAALLLLLAAPGALHAIQPPSHKPLPNYDARQRGADKIVDAEKQAATDALAARVPGLKVERDEIFGGAKAVGSTSGSLTGTNGTGGAVSALTAAAIPAADPHRPIKAFLNEHAAVFGFDASALVPTRVTHDFVAAHNGLRTVVWQQEVDGIAVFNCLLAGFVTAKGELVKVTSDFVPKLPVAVASVKNRAALLAVPPVTAREAVRLAAAN
ncbi:MAG: hypothetical protein HY301_21440, partial [Verrucomicrobia bacterium]|nr:hypothetical protein [Verrucomicrobiota bacterium]